MKIEEIMSIATFLKIPQFATILLVVIVVWKYVAKSAFEMWLKNKLEIKREKNKSELELEKAAILNSEELEKVKLVRVVPILEELNSNITLYSTLFNTYVNAIANLNTIDRKNEDIRVKYDEIILDKIGEISIYIPREFRNLLFSMRRTVSCSFTDPITKGKILRQLGKKGVVERKAAEIHHNMLECFWDFCSIYITPSIKQEDYISILKKYGMDENSIYICSDPVGELAFKFIVQSEYFSDREIVTAQDEYEKLGKLNVSAAHATARVR